MKLAILEVLPGLRLYLADPEQELDSEQRAAWLREPRFWTFCWPAGRVLARYLLENPACVRGKTVCDLGAGSGVVAIAALQAGAKRAFVVDNDPQARQACHRNAALNRVRLEEGQPPHDLLLAADLLYDPANERLLTHPCLLADCRAQPGPGFRLIGQYDSAPLPDLGFEAGFRRVGLWESAGTP